MTAQTIQELIQWSNIWFGRNLESIELPFGPWYTLANSFGYTDYDSGEITIYGVRIVALKYGNQIKINLKPEELE